MQNNHSDSHHLKQGLAPNDSNNPANLSNSTNSPPLPSNGKLNLDEGSVIKRVAGKVFDKVLKETPSNSITTIPPSFGILWRPNNYRRQMEIKDVANSGFDKIKSAIHHYYPNATINQNSHTKIISTRLSTNLTLQFGKKTLIGIHAQNIINGNKETFYIEAYNVGDLDKRISMIATEIQSEIDKVIVEIATKSELILPESKIKWSRYEDWVKGEDFIDNLPREVIIHDTFFKKVYGQGIEFKSTGKENEEPVVHMKNYIKNRAIEEIAPQVALELETMNSKVNAAIDVSMTIVEANASTSKLINNYIQHDLKQSVSLLEFHKDVKIHNKEIKDLSLAVIKLKNGLTERQKRLGDYL